jgi:tripartite-type tricarboxylate transporter receptor subunit TctC
MFSRASGVPLLHVPYKGGAPALQDTMAGMVPCCFSTLGEVMPQLSTGRLRPLAITGAKRTRFLPDVPTLVELGFKDIVVEPWIGILMPAGTPEPIVTRASRLLAEALREPSVRETFARGGSEPLITPPDKFAEMVKADVARWGSIVAASGFTPEE